MNTFDDRYYKLNQTILRFFGLWPYKKTKFEHFRLICCYVLLISYALAQLGQLVIVADFSIDVIIRILADALPAVLFIVKFNLFSLNMKKVKTIMDQIMNDWQMLMEVHEIKIAEQYARQGKYVTIILAALLACGLATLLIIELLPDILDFVWPLNESRVRYLLSMNEYYKHRTQFYPILLYIFINIFIGASATLAISTMMLLFNLHCCAIFKISSYRIEHTVDKKIIACPNKKNVMVQRIIGAVKLHRSARKINDLLLTSFTTSFLVIIVLGMISLTVSLYRLLRAIINMDNLLELLVSIGFVIAHKMYLFGTSYGGQLMTDHADELFHAIYKSLWYLAPMKIQKLLLFMMQISLKAPNVNLGGVYVSLMDSFTRISSTSISYVMVLYSMQ